MTQISAVAALAAVMDEVQAVRKGDRNQQQGFSFRGVDAVVNAVGPAFRRHGVVVGSEVVSHTYDSVEVGAKRTPMGHARVTVRYRFYGPAGDFVEASAAAEAMDSGDKATAKAMSVAYRTVLLQTLALPTDDPDPDATSYERSAHGPAAPDAPTSTVRPRQSATTQTRTTDVNSLKVRISQAMAGAKPAEIKDAVTKFTGKAPNAWTVEDLQGYLEHLSERGAA